MKCSDIRSQLDAWMDRELSLEKSREVTEHLDLCPACRKEAEALTALGLALDNLGPVAAPRGFSRQVRQAVRAMAEPPSLSAWWRHLTLVWRSAVCGAALAGLVFGAVMGTSVAATLDTDTTTPYQSMYDNGRIYP